MSATKRQSIQHATLHAVIMGWVSAVLWRCSKTKCCMRACARIMRGDDMLTIARATRRVLWLPRLGRRPKRAQPEPPRGAQSRSRATPSPAPFYL